MWLKRRGKTWNLRQNLKFTDYEIIISTKKNQPQLTFLECRNQVVWLRYWFASFYRLLKLKKNNEMKQKDGKPVGDYNLRKSWTVSAY